MIKTIRRFFAASAALGVLTVAGPALAQVNADGAATIEAAQSADGSPGVFIEKLVDELRTLAIAKDAGEPVDLNLVFSRDLAVSQMQRQLLSRTAREGASEEEYARYEHLFPAYIAAVYADSIDRLVSRRIEVDDIFERRPGDYIVRSRLFDNNDKARARIDWRVLERDGEMFLVDVLVEGQSVNIERRAQFTSLVSRGGFASLISHMEDFLAS